MTTRVGINGFGRVGRQSLKALIERAPDVEVVAINDLVPVALDALLFKHDSTYGTYPGVVDHTDDLLIVDGRQIRVFQEKDPAALPWGDLGVDIVLESTGIFTDAEKAKAHIDCGCPEGDHQRAGQGRGHHDRPRRQRGPLRPGRPPHHQQRLCTTNCLAPAAKVVHDLRRHREGADEHDPQLHQRPAHPRRRAQGSAPRPQRRPEHHPDDDRRGQGAGPRDPRAQGQVRRLQPARPDADRERRRLHRDVSRDTSVDELNDAFRTAAAGPMKGILGVSDEPLVSMDFKGDSRSSIIDADSTMVLGGNMVKVIAWYDNEWGYSCRVADLIAFVAARLPVAA